MKKTASEIYAELLSRLENDLVILQDKPEENAVNTLAALWCKAAGIPMSVERAAGQLLPELDGEQQDFLTDLVAQRLLGVPLAHLTGRQQFMGIEFFTSPAALIPRKETEILGKAAMELLGELSGRFDHPHVMDICTGAGNLAVALALQRPDCKVVASDLSPDAIALARKNTELHQLADRVSLYEGDLFLPFDNEDFFASIDLITCNPPYISTAKVGEMGEEISGHEPSLAFDGGAFGIKILHRLIKEAPKYMKNGGWLAFEVGQGQGAAILKRMEKKYSYSRVVSVTDESGHIRAVLACL